METWTSPHWIALASEAAIAAESLALGVTMLGRANYAQRGLYSSAFFNLSVGLERSSKLAIVLDHCIDHRGLFPTDAALRKYGHNLERLLKRTEAIAAARFPGHEHCQRPNSDIHDGIVKTLSEFALSTRYYNLDFLVQSGGASLMDPMHAWYLRVGEPILKKHYTKRQRARDEAKATLLEDLLGEAVMVRHTDESHQPLETVSAAASHFSRTKLIQKFGRLYTLQIARHLAVLVSNLQRLCHEQRMEEIPFLDEFFVLFRNPDEYFKSRQTWSIYRL